MGGRAVGDGRQRYRRWEVELQKMGDRYTGDGGRAAGDGRQRYRR